MSPLAAHRSKPLAGIKRFCLCAGAGLLLVLAGCASAPNPQLRSSSVGAASFQVTPAQAADLTIYALGLVGTPYRYGGNTPESGFDCSGLIGHVFKTRAGVVPPRTVAQLSNWGQALDRRDIRSGDLIFFGDGHAGIYVGDNRFVHAPSSGGDVRLDSLNSKYWSAQSLAYRRP